MSQAENSTPSFNRFELSHVQATQPGQESDAEPTQLAAWQTLHFPNTLDVDAIPQAILTEASDRGTLQPAEMAAPAELLTPEPVRSSDHPVTPLVVEPSPMPSEPVIAPDSTSVTEQIVASTALTVVPQAAPADDSLTALTQENQTLRCQLVELEGALERSQAVLRVEADRWQAKTLTQSVQESQRFQRQAAQLTQQSQALTTAQENLTRQSQELQILREQGASQTQELTMAQERLEQMFQELEHAHKTTQRQQILVETLTEQLETSQERVAQLERECSLTQQRYTEQVQLTLQAESASKDLRSRLNRQQRYTLQFKAALEKCLEVPAAQGFAHSALSQHPDSEAVQSEGLTAIAPTAVFIPKAQPVQPWSAHPGFLAALQFPLADSTSQREADPIAEVEELPEGDDQQKSATLTDRIAPRIASRITTERILDAIELPCLGNKAEVSVDVNDSLADHEFADPVSPQGTIAPLDSLSEIDLWATEDSFNQAPAAQSDEVIHLALPSPIAGEVNSVESAKADSNQAASLEMSTPVEQTSADEIPGAEVTEPSQLLLAAAAPVMIPSTAGKSIDTAQRLSPFITLADRQALAAQSEAESAAVNSSPASPFYTHGPSPVVYPLRATKKLSSLAAVKLPSFPKSK